MKNYHLISIIFLICSQVFGQGHTSPGPDGADSIDKMNHIKCLETVEEAKKAETNFLKHFGEDKSLEYDFFIFVEEQLAIRRIISVHILNKIVRLETPCDCEESDDPRTQKLNEVIKFYKELWKTHGECEGSKKRVSFLEEITQLRSFYEEKE